MLTEIQERFFYWIKERETIRIRKERQEFPLTQDPILSTYRFCNVDREYDAVTRWVKANVRDAFTHLAVNIQLMNLAAARIFNHPETLGELLPITDFTKAAEALQDRKKAGLKILRGAYLMPPHRKGATSAVDYWLEVVQEVGKREYVDLHSLQDYASVLSSVRGLGPFLVNQLCTDLRYMPLGQNSSDWETFLLCGPGTVRGLNRLYTGDPKVKACKPKEYVSKVLDLRNILKARFPNLQETFRDPNNTANCLCEFDKYERCLENMLAENPKRIKMRKFNTLNSAI